MGYFNVGKSSNITYIDTAVNIGYAVKVELYGTWSKLAFVWKYNAWNDDIIFVFFISAQRRWLVFLCLEELYFIFLHQISTQSLHEIN